MANLQPVHDLDTGTEATIEMGSLLSHWPPAAETKKLLAVRGRRPALPSTTYDCSEWSAWDDGTVLARVLFLWEEERGLSFETGISGLIHTFHSSPPAPSKPLTSPRPRPRLRCGHLPYGASRPQGVMAHEPFPSLDNPPLASSILQVAPASSSIYRPLVSRQPLQNHHVPHRQSLRRHRRRPRHRPRNRQAPRLPRRDRLRRRREPGLAARGRGVLQRCGRQVLRQERRRVEEERGRRVDRGRRGGVREAGWRGEYCGRHWAASCCACRIGAGGRGLG